MSVAKLPLPFIRRFASAPFRALPLAIALLTALQPAVASALSLFGTGRGINTGAATWTRAAPGAPAVYQINADRWSPTLLAQIRASGFGFVRLVVTPLPLVTNDATGRARAVAQISGMLDHANAAGLSAVVDFHPWPADAPVTRETLLLDQTQYAQLINAQKVVATMLATKPAGRVALELLNEPPCLTGGGGSPVDWPAIQRDMVRQVRSVAPHLPLVLTACGGLPEKLIAIDASAYFGDPQIFWTFHYYQPSAFVGQQASGLLGVPFPPDAKLANSPAALHAMLPLAALAKKPRNLPDLRAYLTTTHGEATIAADMNKIVAWARRNRIAPGHILMGEFGTDLTRDNPTAAQVRSDELRLLSATRRQAEGHGFVWSYWSWGARTMNYDPQTHFVSRDTLGALGLATNP